MHPYLLAIFDAEPLAVLSAELDKVLRLGVPRLGSTRHRASFAQDTPTLAAVRVGSDMPMPQAAKR